tara:strand:- start:241 stop:381 length:141 start_codon:yes stop_codon:yes gene_type:complete
MTKSNNSNSKEYKTVILNTYKLLMDEGRIKKGGAAEKRYNVLLRRK